MTASIPPATLEKFTTFGDLLRFLRRRAGITQMELAIAVGYSDAQISRLEQNLRLPDLTTIEARFVPALELEEELKAVSRLLDLAANVRREDAPGLGLCPYKGLSYFDEADADLFVGREELTSRLADRVLRLAVTEAREPTRFLAVIGASGSGKSSLVRAGLIPALRWNKKSAEWNILVFTPTSHPLESLAGVLTAGNESVATTVTLMDDLARDPRSLYLYMKHKLQRAAGDNVLLVVDQFEEVFALCRSEDERLIFIGNLLTAVSEADGPVRIVLTLRADFYAQCANYPQLREALAQNQEYIGAMNPDELRRAIEEPAKRGRWEFEPGLVDLLLHDVGREPGALPLLSHALFETWQRRRNRMMTMSGYASSGGVRGAIAETAESVFTDQFTNEQRRIARRIFLRLTELSDESSMADTRRRATYDELILKKEEASVTRTVLKMLADARLIITSEDSAEVAHEALIREWPTLRGWLEENRAGLRLHRQLTETAQEWAALEQSLDLLYRGARLAQAREWASVNDDELNSLEREFLLASIEESEREIADREAQRQRELIAAQKLAEVEHERAEEQKRTAGQLRRRSFYFAGAFVVAVIMAIAAFLFGSQAQTTSRLATSRELAAASISNLDIDPERSILLALEAMEAGHTIEAEDALHRAIQTSRIELIIQAHEPGAASMVAFSPDGRQFLSASADGTVRVWNTLTGSLVMQLNGTFAAFRPDGKQLAIAAADGTIRIVEAASGQAIQVPGQMDAKLSVAFSPDGTRLVSVGLGNTPIIWNSKTGRELVAFPGHTDFISSAVFSPDGTRILTASDDGTARIWNARTGEQLIELGGHHGFVWYASFNPDGTRVATASGNVAYVWNASTGERIFTLAGHKNEIFTVIFSPDGSRIATGSLDRKIKIWDAATGRDLFTLSGHDGAIFTLSFSPDGTHLASSSDDGTVRVWNIAPSREFLTLAMQTASGQVAYTGDGTKMAAAEDDGKIRIWDAHTGRELIAIPGSGSFIKDMVFSPDGKRLFAATVDSKITTWDSATGSELNVFPAHSAIINGLAMTLDGNYLATASDDYKAKIWDISSGVPENQPLLTLDHPGNVYSIAFNPDGSKLVTGVQDGTARIWEAAAGREIMVLRGHLDSVVAVAFNADGTRIATASIDGTAKIWNASTGGLLLVLQGHNNAVSSIAFSPDDTRIATVSFDGTMKVWDAGTGNELLNFTGDSSGLSDVTFNPDGRLLAAGGENGVRVYLLNIEDLIELAHTRVTRELSFDECQKYLHRDQADCAPTAAIPTTTAIPPADQGRVCQVTSIGGLYDASFNEKIFKGLQDSNARFGWDVKVLQSVSVSDYGTNIHEFTRGDCDLIVGLLQMADSIQSASQTNPDQKFQIMDYVYDQPLENVRMQVFATDQAAFLAGYTAASVTKTGRVGVFGGIDFPPVTDFMDGFALGVEYYNQESNTNIEVLGWDPQEHAGLFLGGFCCAAEGRQMTQELLDQGADVILPVAGTEIGAGALFAVQSHGDAYIIGVDTDWTVTDPGYADIILTSILKNYDVSVVQAVRAIEEDTFVGGINTGTLESGEVGLAPFHQLDALVSAKVRAELEQIKADIIAGKIQTKP